jgi:hypothetical protein
MAGIQERGVNIRTPFRYNARKRASVSSDRSAPRCYQLVSGWPTVCIRIPGPRPAHSDCFSPKAFIDVELLADRPAGRGAGIVVQHEHGHVVVGRPALWPATPSSWAGPTRRPRHKLAIVHSAVRRRSRWMRAERSTRPFVLRLRCRP